MMMAVMAPGSTPISMGLCKKDVTPLLTHWSYVFLALNPRYEVLHQDIYKYRDAIGRTVEIKLCEIQKILLSGVPDYFGRNKISSGGDLSHYSSASLY